MPKVNKKDPEKPKGAKSAYNYFLQDNKEQMKGEGALSLKDFSRSCAEKWKSMSEEEKKPFHEKAVEDKERYKQDMASYSPPPAIDVVPKKIRKKQAKDPNRPKRNLNAYLFFLAEKRASVKEGLENPTAGAVVKILGEMWAKTPDQDKVKYQDLAKKDKVRYEDEMRVYKGQKKLPVDNEAVENSD